jgi:hypothetical protein
MLKLRRIFLICVVFSLCLIMSVYAREVSAGASGSAADYPQVSITNGLIRMKVYLPDARTGYYRGTRFDWAGVISDLEFAGHNYYPQWFQRMDTKVRDFTYEEQDIVAGPCTAMTGTPEEFVTNSKALGFDEARPGGTFIKIGVGVLRRPDDSPYQQFQVYEIMDGGKWTVNRKTDSIEFVHELADPNSGYAYIYRKTVSLTSGKAQMVLSHSLRNTGQKTIGGSVYNHNFLYLDRQAPGPDFTVTVPFEIRSAGTGRVGAAAPAGGGLTEIRKNQVFFTRTLTGSDTARALLQGFGADANDYDIRIENSKVAAGVRITADRPLSRLFLWSIRAPLSVEPYIDMNIEPGSEFTWNIKYDYYSLPQNRSN